MIINEKNLCNNCFVETEVDGVPCPACGYKDGDESKYPTALPVGTILLGRYIIGRVLGKGGFGVTYLAFDSRDEKKVAVKEYLPDTLIHRNTGETFVSTFYGDKEEAFKKGAERFFEEAQTISRFNGNPNIVAVYEFFYENNTAYFIMEYLEGDDLKSYVSKNGGALTEEQILTLLKPLIDALIVVHSVGVLHRDISPDNIYITNDGKIKLLDFGAARQVLGEASKSLSVVLKQGFAPIEQYQTRGKQGQWTDIYALGATMLYCLTGQVPEASMDRIDEDILTLPGNISNNFKAVLQKMIAVRAINRFQDMTELKRGIESPETPLNTPVQDAPAPLAVPEKGGATAFIKKYKIAFSILAACLVIAISVTGILLLGNDNKARTAGNNANGGEMTNNSGENDASQTSEESSSYTENSESTVNTGSVNQAGNTSQAASSLSSAAQTSSRAASAAQASSAAASSQASKASVPAVTTVSNQRYTYSDPYMSGASGSYTGDWKDGKPHGNGTFIFDSSFAAMGYPAKYTGQWVNGNKHGQGTATWSDGSVYTGSFKNNKKSGQGKMTNPDGSVFWNGNWIDDAPEK